MIFRSAREILLVPKENQAARLFSLFSLFLPLKDRNPQNRSNFYRFFAHSFSTLFLFSLASLFECDFFTMPPRRRNRKSLSDLSLRSVGTFGFSRFGFLPPPPGADDLFLFVVNVLNLNWAFLEKRRANWNGDAWLFCLWFGELCPNKKLLWVEEGLVFSFRIMRKCCFWNL